MRRGRGTNGVSLLCVMGFLTWAVAVGAVEPDRARWSVTFRNATVSSALEQLSEVTGIRIIARDVSATETVSRTYTKRTVEQIIKDLCKDVSHAVVWRFDRVGTPTVEVRVYGLRGSRTGEAGGRPQDSLRPGRGDRRHPVHAPAEAPPEEPEKDVSGEPEPPSREEEASEESSAEAGAEKAVPEPGSDREDDSAGRASEGDTESPPPPGNGDAAPSS